MSVTYWSILNRDKEMLGILKSDVMFRGILKSDIMSSDKSNFDARLDISIEERKVVNRELGHDKWHWGVLTQIEFETYQAFGIREFKC